MLLIAPFQGFVRIGTTPQRGIINSIGYRPMKIMGFKETTLIDSYKLRHVFVSEFCLK